MKKWSTKPVPHWNRGTNWGWPTNQYSRIKNLVISISFKLSHHLYSEWHFVNFWDISEPATLKIAIKNHVKIFQYVCKKVTIENISLWNHPIVCQTRCQKLTRKIFKIYLATFQLWNWFYIYSCLLHLQTWFLSRGLCQRQLYHARTQKVFSVGVQHWRFCCCFFELTGWREDRNATKSEPSSARHWNSVSLACR